MKSLKGALAQTRSNLSAAKEELAEANRAQSSWAEQLATLREEAYQAGRRDQREALDRKEPAREAPAAGPS